MLWPLSRDGGLRHEAFLGGSRKARGIDELREAQRLSGIAPADQGGDELALRGGGLDAVAALPDTPEEAFHFRVPADRKAPVGGEAAQARPAMLHALDLDIERLLHPVDRDRDI